MLFRLFEPPRAGFASEHDRHAIVHGGDELVRRAGEDRCANRSIGVARACPNRGEGKGPVRCQAEEVGHPSRAFGRPFVEAVGDDQAAAPMERFTESSIARQRLAAQVDLSAGRRTPAQRPESPPLRALNDGRDVLARADVVARPQIHGGARRHAELLDDHVGGARARKPAAHSSMLREAHEQGSGALECGSRLRSDARAANRLARLAHAATNTSRASPVTL